MYDAFISYSHAADGRLAPDLQSALHRFAKPWYRLRAVRVFRDQTSLSATPSLWPMIQKALDESEYFILLASPDAAASVWVGREIEHWLAGKGSRRILIVLTGGELLWNDAASDFDREASSALPAALAGAFAQEPLWIDLKWAERPEQRSLRNGPFRDAVAELAATLHGRPKDEIAGEDVRQHARTRRIAGAAVTALSLLALGLGVAAWIAAVQRDRAEERGAIALSRQLAAQAVSLAGTDRGDLALLLGIEALNVFPTVDARNGLLTALTRDPRRLFHLHGHMGEVESLAFSTDGRELLSLGCEGVDVLGLCSDFGVRRFASENGAPLGEVVLPGATRWTVLSDASRTGALVARDGRGNEWNPLTGKARGRPALPGVWSPRGEVVELENDALVLREPETGRRVRLDPTHTGGRVRSVAFHPSSPFMATGGANGEVRLWKTEDVLEGALAPERVLAAHREDVIDLDFHPKGAHLVSASWDDTVLVWELDSDAPPRQLVESGRIVSVVFSPDGRRMVIARSIGEESGELQLWDAVSLRPLATLAGKAPIAFSPDGRLLAAAGADGAVIVRDLERTRPLGRELASPGDPQSLAFLEDGRALVAGGRDDSLRIWDVEKEAEAPVAVRTEHGDVSALAAHPDGRRLASAGDGGRVLLWNLREGGLERQRVLEGHEGTVFALDFSADGERLVSGGFDGTLRVWDVASGDPIGTPIQVGSDIYGVVFDGPAERVAAAAEDGSVLLWELADDGASGRVLGTHLLQSDGMTGLAFGPEDRFLISSSLEQTQFWGLTNDEPSVRPPLAGSFVALHPSGELAAVVTDSDEIQLLDVVAWRPFDSTLGAQEDLVHAMAFSPDGRLLASAAEDDLLLWEVALDGWRARGCAVAKRNLTDEEWRRFLGERERPQEASCPGISEPPSIPLDAGRALGLAERAAKLGNETEARRLFAEAAEQAATIRDAELANQICWFGASRRAAEEVFAACERAVELDPDDVGYRDSRGLARALRGDRAGAIEDFRAYVAEAGEDPRRDDRVARRRRWIRVLEAGRDPFDAMELHQLRGERPF